MNWRVSLAVFLAIISFHTGNAFADAGENRYQANGNSKNIDKSGEVGLGLMFGSTTGVTAKIWTNEINAFDLGVAFQDTDTAIMGDYLWHWRNAFSPSSNSAANTFVPYLGVGLIGAFGGNTNFFYHNTQTFGLGARVPIGLEFIPRALPPLGFFAELDPGIGFVPDGFSFFEANIGGRYYF